MNGRWVTLSERPYLLRPAYAFDSKDAPPAFMQHDEIGSLATAMRTRNSGRSTYLCACETTGPSPGVLSASRSLPIARAALNSRSQGGMRGAVDV